MERINNSPTLFEGAGTSGSEQDRRRKTSAGLQWV